MIISLCFPSRVECTREGFPHLSNETGGNERWGLLASAWTPALSNESVLVCLRFGPPDSTVHLKHLIQELGFEA